MFFLPPIKMHLYPTNMSRSNHIESVKDDNTEPRQPQREALVNFNISNASLRGNLDLLWPGLPVLIHSFFHQQ